MYKQNNQFTEENNLLDGCHNVYLDVGTNIGVSIRKLFEPEKYPNASLHSIFDANFGTLENRLRVFSENDKMLCAVGFEPNIDHSLFLKEIETAYHKCGWKIKIMTETAVSDHTGTATFYRRISSNSDNHPINLGAGIHPPKINYFSDLYNQENTDKGYTIAKLLRLSDFVKTVVNTRRLPIWPRSTPPKVVMKMDIEGSEVEVVPDLIFSGALQYIDVMSVEWHGFAELTVSRKEAHGKLKDVLEKLSTFPIRRGENGNSFRFSVIEMDDETYFKTKFELPKC